MGDTLVIPASTPSGESGCPWSPVALRHRIVRGRGDGSPAQGERSMARVFRCLESTREVTMDLDSTPPLLRQERWGGQGREIGTTPSPVA